MSYQNSGSENPSMTNTNYKDLLGRRHVVACFITALFGISLLAIVASAQESEPQPNACFEIIPARQNARPEGAFLLNRCTGQSWLLTRIDGARARQAAVVGYRWSLLAADDIEMKKSSPRPDARVPARARPSADKCFNFQGRQFCE